AFKRDHVSLGRRAEVAGHGRAIAGDGEVVLQHAHIVAPQALVQDAVAHVIGVARVVMPGGISGSRPAKTCPAAARAAAGKRACRRGEGNSHGACDAMGNSSKVWVAQQNPFSFVTPTGLAGGLALKEIALRRWSGDSPQEPK